MQRLSFIKLGRKNKFSRNIEKYFVGMDEYGRHIYKLYNSFCFCPDLREVGEWLLSAHPMLIEGNLFYSPHFSYEGAVDVAYRQRISSFEYLRDALIANRRVLDKLSKKSLKAGLMKPILKLELPILEKVDLPTFAKITHRR